MTDVHVTAFRTYCHRQTGLLLIKTGRWTTSEYTKHAISRFLKIEIFRRTICSSINPPPSHTGYRSTSVPQSSQLEVHFPSTIQQIGCLSVVEGWVEHYSWNTNCDLSIFTWMPVVARSRRKQLFDPFRHCHSAVVFHRVFMFFSCFYVLFTVYVVVFYQWHFIDLFSCIAASLFNKLTYLLIIIIKAHPSCRPTNSVKALKAKALIVLLIILQAYALNPHWNFM